MWHNIFLNVLAVAVLVGIITGAVNFWAAKKAGEAVSMRYIISAILILLLYSGLFYYIQYESNQKIAGDKKTYSKQIAKLKNEQKAQEQQTKMIEADYEKEIAFMQWKNRVFTSNNELENSLAGAQKEYNLSPAEVKMWQSVAANNTLEQLVPKRNTNDVLKEYQSRLKQSLSQIKSGGTLLTSDIRVLSDNINSIRFIGKEYEKVLDSFRDLYQSITANNDSGKEPDPPKQKYFLFFPVKQKEYEDLLKQYYEAKGNKTAVADVAVKLKAVIDQAEEDFAAINKKFEDNLSFLENNSNTITYDSGKLGNLIQATINEADIVSETQPVTNPPIKVTNKASN